MADAEAKKETEGKEPAAPKAGAAKWIIVAAVTLAIMGGSIGGAVYMISPPTEDPAAAAEEGSEHGIRPAIYFDFKDSFIVPFIDGARSHYLQTELSVMARDQAVVDAIKVHAPLIRGRIIDIIGRQQYAVMQTDEGRQRLREDVRALIEGVVQTEVHLTGVESVLLTSFVMQ